MKTQWTGEKKYRLEIRSDEYNAFYKAEDGIEVKKVLVNLTAFQNTMPLFLTRLHQNKLNNYSLTLTLLNHRA